MAAEPVAGHRGDPVEDGLVVQHGYLVFGHCHYNQRGPGHRVVPPVGE